MRSKELQTVLAAIRTEAGPIQYDRSAVDRGAATIRSALRTRRRASWLTYNVFCATGDGGGIDPSCKATDPATGKPEAKTKRTKEIEDAAERIEFTEDRIHEEGIERNDYDAIEEALSDSEREELDQYLENRAENYANEYDVNADVYVDRDLVAKELGWSDEDVKDKTLEKIDELEEAAAEDDETDWDGLREKVDEWYKNTNDHGTDAINSLQKKIRRDSPDALHDYLNELHDEAGEEIDKSEEEYSEMREQELRQEVRDNYDSSDDRQEWLQNWYDENYSGKGGIEKENIWGRDKDGDRVYGFTTSQGQFYKATVFNEKTSYGVMKNFVFEDEDGSFSKTGKGNALEVFRTISAAATAYVKKEDPDFLTFTAAEKSRQTLYDRLVRTLAGIDGDRVAYATIPQSGKEVRRYVVVKRSRRADLEAILAATPNIPREVLVNAKTKLVRLGPPEDAWFEETAWEEFEPKRTDNAKRLPSPRKNEWRVTIQRLAPYLTELMPDLTRTQSRGIARSIKRGLEFEMQDEEVARLIEAYDIEPERARTIARTEMARAREDGKIGRLKPGQRLRYKLADGACPKCVKVARRLKGRRLTAYQAKGIIPVHVNCLCMWETVSAKTGRKITTNESGEARDEILKFARMTENVFCATGEGGGVDPSCSSKGNFPSNSADTPHVKSLNLTGLTDSETRAAKSAIEKALTVGDHKISIDSVSVESIPYSAQYKRGAIKIDPTTIDAARSHDRSKVIGETESLGGSRNTAKEEGRNSEEYLSLELAHELAHHVEQALLLDFPKSLRMAKDEGIDFSEKSVMKLSGYATVNTQEMFAEAHALITQGKGELVPKPLRRWYDLAISTADPVPIARWVLPKS